MKGKHVATTLAQLLAVIRGLKQRENDLSSELYKQLQKSGSFNGETRTYHNRVDGGIERAPTGTNIVAGAKDILNAFRIMRTRLMDITYTMDMANRNASADLVVDGELIAEQVPAVTLLGLEKHADDIVAIVKALPVLDPTEKWTYDENTGAYRSEPAQTLSTSKETVPLVLWEPEDPATSKHQPQVQVITKDVVVGDWTTTKFSSAVPADRKRQLLERAETFREAVKFAREEANRAVVTDVTMGKRVFDWLLAE